jgi:hypothetical protein
MAKCVIAMVLAAGLPAFAATSGYFEGWDVDGDTAGWQPNTLGTTVIQLNPGGNPGGFLLSSRVEGFDIGALNGSPALAGDFSGMPWIVSFDLNYIGGQFTTASLRFRYHDDTFNGWQRTVAGVFPAGWNSYSVAFDPSWTDVQAMAAGWTTDLPGGLDSVSWSQTMADVYYTEVRIAGIGNLRAGIDNFSLRAVPEPSTCALLMLGIAFLRLRRRQ